MKKKEIIVGVIVVVITLCLLGCSQEASTKETTTDGSQETEQESSVEEETDDAEALPIVRSGLHETVFSEGLAWVQYDIGDDEYFGCIDTEGNVVFQMPYEDITGCVATPFENGYSYIHEGFFVGGGSHNLTCYVISKDGEVKGRYEDVVAYGDGYTMVEESTQGFDSSYYTYTLYDADGEATEAYIQEGNDPLDEVYYCGQGVFALQSTAGVIGYYFADEKRYMDNETGFEEAPSFSSDSEWAILGYTHYNEEEKGYRWDITLMDTQGNTRVVRPDIDEWSIYGATLSGDICLIHGNSYPQDYLYAYNIETGSVAELSSEYNDMVSFNKFDYYSFEEGKVVLQLTGADDEYYLAVFDASLNMIGGPLKYSSYKGETFSDERLVLDSEVYDEELNLVFEYDLGLTTSSGVIASYSDGLLCLLGSDGLICYNVDGDVVFEGISIDEAVSLDYEIGFYF